jgi:Spy/CpxP family protein refolding chaperone
VTIVGTAVSEKSLRRPLLWVVVALSLALNLFFVAGALWTRLQAPPSVTREERLQQMAQALALDPQQRLAFATYSQTMREQLLAMRDAAGPLVRAAWAEVSRPQADETKVMQLVDQAALARRGHLLQITATTIAFLKILSPEQRAEFVKLVHQGRPPWALQFHRP